MDGAVGMFGRGVERVQLELTRSRVDHVVPGAGGDHDRPVVRDVVRLIDPVFVPTELHAGLSLLDPDELVPVGVDLLADVLAGCEPHHGELAVRAGVENGPEGLVLERQVFDVSDPTDHRRPPLIAYHTRRK